MKNIVLDALLGVSVADAIGVPVEFVSRQKLDENPVAEMRGYGTYNMPHGTWSDDSSLTFCLAESLVNGYNLGDIAQKLVAWRDKAYWTANGEVFDIGKITNVSISLLKDIVSQKDFSELEKLHEHADQYTNGNGALMRILPLIFYIKGKPIDEQFRITWQVSALTHGHVRSAVACLIYLRMAEKLINKTPKLEAYQQVQTEIKQFFEQNQEASSQAKHFNRIIFENIADLDRNEINSGGYVIDSIEASFWCLLRNQTYSETVLEAVNLGADTDTTAAIAGGLAGIIYGAENIPQNWKEQLARLEDIKTLSNKLFERHTEHTGA